MVHPCREKGKPKVRGVWTGSKTDPRSLATLCFERKRKKKEKRFNKLAEAAKIPSQGREQSSLKDRQAGTLN